MKLIPWLMVGACCLICTYAGAEEYVQKEKLAKVELSPLACDYRLPRVVDSRENAGSGSLTGRDTVLTFPDAADAIADQLAALSWSVQPDAPAVEIRIRRLYVHSLWAIRAGVAVYEVAVDGETPFLVRAQPNETGSNANTEAAYRHLGAAMAEANQSLITMLNQRCSPRTSVQGQ